ncbi:MAG: proline dehydrogenase family protein [Actinomycetota bacterium]
MSLFTRVAAATAAAGPVRKAITGTRAGRALARRFVAGDGLDAAVGVARRLQGEGLGVSLDLLGEDVTDREGAEQATRGYLEALERIRAEGLRANISIKLTQLGLAIDPAMADRAVDRLATAAAEAGTTVTIDMEDSRYTQATVDIYARAQPRHGNLGICLQAYLHRTPADLERLLPLGGHIRLCKGAYVEPPEVAIQKRADVEEAFARLLAELMAAPETRPAIATHDPRLIAATLAAADRRGDGFEFQMLYGVRSDEQRRLSALGHDVRVYIPYGSAWYPYLTRRLAERPANAWFFLRALFGR